MSAPQGEDGYSMALMVGYAVASVVNVVAAAANVELFAMITKPFLMLLLFCWAWQALPKPRPPGGRYLLVGILFAWLGDVFLMPDGQLFFLLGIVGFFVMQISYILAFRAVPGPHLLRRIPWLLIPFVLYWAVMNWLLDPGILRIPILLYSVVLVGMSVAALDLTARLPSPHAWRLFVGSVLFVISDSLIAVDEFSDYGLGRWQGLAVMATYVVAQYLIVTGFVRGVAPRGAGAVFERPTPEEQLTAG